MPVKNYTQNSINLLSAWFEGKLEGDMKSIELLRTTLVFRDDIFGDFFGYLLTILSITYLVFFVCMLIVFVREKMLGIVQVILLTTTSINLVPLLAGTPVLAVFHFVANREEPVPYPSCFIIVLFYDIVAKIVHVSNLLLKFLLGLNRVCSVYYPLKLKIWFSNFRCILYIISIVSFTIVLGCILNFIDTFVEKTLYVGDLWGNGKIRAYETCSLEKVTIGEKSTVNLTFIISLVQLALAFVLIASLITLNIIFVVKLRRLQSKSFSDPIKNETNVKNDRKMHLINKIAFWVMVSSIFTELPHAALVGYAFGRIISLMMKGSEKFAGNNTFDMINAFAGLFFKLVIPLDLFIFVCLSKKVRTAIKKLFTCSKK